MHRAIKVNVVVWHDKTSWIAQGLEFDIAVSADAIDELQYQFERCVVGHIAASVRSGGEPLLDVPPAPQKFWDLHRDGREIELRPVSRFMVSEAPDIDFTIEGFKLAAQAS